MERVNSHTAGDKRPNCTHEEQKVIPQSRSLGGISGEESACPYRRHRRRRFDPWVRKIPWRGEWQPTQGFFHGESHGQESLVDYSPWGHKGSDVTKHWGVYSGRCHEHIGIVGR